MSYALQQEIEVIKNSCMLCGRCTDVCPSCEHGGLDPMEVMAGGEEALDMCVLCGNCSRTCRRSDPFTVIRTLIAIQNDIHVSDLYKETGLVRPAAEDRCIDPVWSGDDAYVMSGCTVESLVPYLEYAGSKAMSAIGVKASKLPNGSCCLHPIQFMEVPKNEKRSMKLEIIDSAQGRPIVALCPGCSEELEQVNENVEHIIPFLHGHLEDLPVFERRVKVGMEPGCSAEPFRKEMKAILSKMNCEIVNNDFGCCGKSSPLADDLMEAREAECDGADVIVVGCPMCLAKYDERSGGLPVVHIAELVAVAAGYAETLAFHRIPVEF